MNAKVMNVCTLLVGLAGCGGGGGGTSAPSSSLNATGSVPIQEYLSESFEWTSYQVVTSLDPQNSYSAFGFYRSQSADGRLAIYNYELNDTKTYSLKSTGTPSGSGVDRSLTTQGNWQQLYFKGKILSYAQIEGNPDQSQYWLKLSTDNGQISLGKWKINIVSEDISGVVTSKIINSAYTGGKDGVFKPGSKIYQFLMESVEPDYFISDLDQSNTANTVEAFTSKYTNQAFCGVATNRYVNGNFYSNTKFGIKFSDNQTAKLVPVDSSTCTEINDNYPLLELNWQKSIINNGIAIELSGKKLPPYKTSLAMIEGSIDSLEANPALTRWTDKYSFVIIFNGNGMISTGVKILPGAVINESPGNGRYFNRTALNSLLELVGYPQFLQ